MIKIISVALALLLTGCVAEEVAVPAKNTNQKVTRVDSKKIEKAGFVPFKSLPNLALNINEESVKLLGTADQPIIGLEVQLVLHEIEEVQGFKIKSYVNSLFIDCLNDQAMIIKTSGYDETNKLIFETAVGRVVKNPEQPQTSLTVLFEYACPFILQNVPSAEPNPGVTI